MTNHRPIWNCTHCGKHCTIRIEDGQDRPFACPYGKPCVWLRRDGIHKEKIVKDWPRECVCGGDFVVIFRARRGEDPREYVECKNCKRVIE